jgi:hypothetical protein
MVETREQQRDKSDSDPLPASRPKGICPRLSWRRSMVWVAKRLSMGSRADLAWLPAQPLALSGDRAGQRSRRSGLKGEAVAG